jgi:DNA (cytosine-5)-methyltransferase 1
VNELALFAGAGGGILGGHLIGWKCRCAVELDVYAASVLIARQNEGILPPFPIWDDVRTFDGLPWRGHIDVVSGGFPCKGVSPAGDGLGLHNIESELWGEQARIIREVEPGFCLVENHANLVSRGLGRVLGDLAEMGYNAQWGVFSASDVGARHERERLWIVASHPDRARFQRGERRTKTGFLPVDNMATSRIFPQHKNDLPAPQLLGGSHGLAARVDRLKAIGNGQVPAVAALAWQILSGTK